MIEPATVLSARGVSRRFGHRYAIKDASFDVFSGDVLLFMGHNGAGKTTLIRLLAGLLKPSEGRICRSAILSVVAHDSMVYESLTGSENLKFFARLYGVRDSNRIDALLDRVGLTEFADRQVTAYSRGMVQRLAIARALLPDPELLLLDEPLTGLDEAAAGMVRELFAEMREHGRAVVVATHQVVELADRATTVGHLVNGELLAVEPAAGRDGADLQARQRELAQDV